jgi:hypothetical protein
MDLEKAFLEVIKKADKPAIVLIIVGLFIVLLLQMYKSDDQFLAMVQLVGGILFILGFGTLILYYYWKNKPTTQTKQRATAKQQRPVKTVLCPNCKNMVEPVKLGKLYRCPYCPHEFKSTSEMLKDAERGYKLLKDISKN